MFEQQKKRFIRWYYGSWVNEPQAEVPMFGAVISYNALRLHAAMRWVRRHRRMLMASLVGFIVLCIVVS